MWFVSAIVVASGVDNGTYTLSGPMIGNTIQLSGILGSQQVELVAYFEKAWHPLIASYFEDLWISYFPQSGSWTLHYN